MKNNNRMTRVNDEISKEIAQIIRGELKDPRISSMTSVVRVETTQDLKYCKVFVSVLGDDQDKGSVISGLTNASGFIRHLIAERVNLRITPEFMFKIDDSLEYSMKISKILDEVSSQPPVGEGEPFE